MRRDACPPVFQVSLCCLHPKEEITVPQFFDAKDSMRNILLALVLLGEANGSTTMDLNKIEKVFREFNNP